MSNKASDLVTVWIDDKINEKILLNLFTKLGPYIMKPNSSGSSYGVKIFRDINDIDIFIFF